MSSLADVAQRAGVSKATASRALSGVGHVSAFTRDRVVSAAAELGYVVSSNAASLVTGRTRNVGVVTPHINRWYFAEVLEGVEAALIAAGYDLTLYRLTEDAEQRRRVFDYFLVRKRVDAVLSIGIALSPSEVARLHGIGKPVVAIGGRIPGVTSMSIDDVELATLATRHLLSLGHRRILHLGGHSDQQTDFHAHAARLEGFRSALAEADASWDGDFRLTPFSIQGGFEAGLELLADPRRRPTAIMAGSDEIAIGAITAARQLGIVVPSQLSVVGIDDHPLAAMFQLTTVRQDPGEQGRTAVQIALDELLGVGRTVGDHIVVPTALKVRSSTTAPPAS